MTLFVGLVLPTILLGTSPVPSAQYVPGEILAKYAPGTDGSAAVTRASRVSPPDLAALDTAVNSLQTETGVPLKATQVMSGNWLKLSIDGDRLTDQLMRRLRTQDNIAEVKVTAKKPEASMDVSLPKELVIKFSPGSPESRTVGQELVDPGDVRFAQLMRALEQDLDLPLKGEVSDQAELLVQVDLRAFTLILVDRIKSLCDIESAQPNYILTVQ